MGSSFADVSPYDIRVAVFNGAKELVSYQEKDQGIPKLAEPAKAAKAPNEIMTNEELYLTGQHIEQYRHATFMPDDCYLEGLKRDPGDIRINNAYGLLLLRRGLFEESEKYFQKAIERLTGMHPSPYDSEPFYNLGLCCFYQERFEEAFDSFYKASWVSELQEMSFYYLAAISARLGNWNEALLFVEKALVKNAHNIKARGLKAAILWKLGRVKEARSWIYDNLELDAFDFVSMYLLLCMSENKDTLEQAFHMATRDFDETYLLIARDLAEAGLYEEAEELLSLFPGDKPMIHYYRGAYLAALGKETEAAEEFTKAQNADSAYCFPNKLEDIAVLYAAIESDNKASKALYYLGCLYYDKLQFDLSIDLWEKSMATDDSFPTLLRNLSIAYYNKRDEKEKARKCLEKAFALDKSDARLFLELDQLYQKLQLSLTKRYEFFQDNLSLIEKRDDLYTEYVTLLNSLGKYDEAYKLISSHNFQTWEGAEGKISAQFKVSLLQQAKVLLAKNSHVSAADNSTNPSVEDITKAIELPNEALTYPENLGEGKLEGTKDHPSYYHLGLAYEMLADAASDNLSVNEKSDYRAKSVECFEKATLGAQEVAGMMYYYDQPADMILYQGLAFKKLRNISAANARFYRLLDYGEHHLNDTFKMDYFAVSMPDMSVFDADMNLKNKAHCFYLMGLGKLGLEQIEESKAFLSKVLELDNAHQNAIIYSEPLVK